MKRLLPLTTFFVILSLGCSGKLDELKAQGDQAKAEAAAWAVGKAQDSCVEEALSRSGMQGETEITYHALNGVWLQACLGAASPTPGLCDGVPATDAITDSVSWRLSVCQAKGRADDQRCGRLMGSIQDHCHPRAQ